MKIGFTKTRVLLGDNAYVCNQKTIIELKAFVKMMNPSEEKLHSILVKECVAIEDAVIGKSVEWIVC